MRLISADRAPTAFAMLRGLPGWRFVEAYAAMGLIHFAGDKRDQPVAWRLAFIPLHVDLWWIRGIMFIRGCFFSFMLVSLQTATFATISPQLMGRASAINSAGRQVGGTHAIEE